MERVGTLLISVELGRIRTFVCHKPRHIMKDCPSQTAEGQVVKAYALGAIPSSSVGPSAEERGKGIRNDGNVTLE